MQYRLLGLAGLTVCVLGLPLSTSAEDDLPTVEEIQRHLYNWRKDFVAFRIGYEDRTAKGKIKFYREFLMTSTKDYLDVFDELYDAENITREMRGGNRQTHFHASYLLNDQKQWELTKTSKENRLNANVGLAMVVHPIYLLFHAHAGKWLDERLLDDKVTIKPGGVIDGEECLLLQVQYSHETDGGGNLFWLAKNKGYLPKKTAPILGHSLRSAEYLCDEFKQQEDRWYPYRGQIGLPPENSFWEVKKFEVNPKVPASTFVPPPPPKGQKTPLVQGEKPTLPAESEGLPTAEPDDWNASSMAMVLLGIAIASVVLAVWSKRRERA